MQVDDIITYTQLAAEEEAQIQRGMNYGTKKGYSVFLMSVRKNAPYADSFDKKRGLLIYEGHDQIHRQGWPDSKTMDQALATPNGRWTENGKFFRAALDYKGGLREKPELIKVYEKISNGIWSYKGFFELLDAKFVTIGSRKVFKFYLMQVEKKSFGRIIELPNTRIIPTSVKIEVWKRDGGQCVLCGSKTNLHYDHEIPYSKGGSSFVAENVRLLCAKHNLEKSDKIMVLFPFIAMTMIEHHVG